MNPQTNRMKRNNNCLIAGFLLIFLLLWMPGKPVAGQDRRGGGVKYTTNYIPSDYSAQPQNWSIIEDKRGVVYVANQGGLLEFDGASWRKISLPNVSVRSLALSSSGTVFTGGTDEIGFLAPGPGGTLQYRSLVHRLDINHKNFGTVWGTHAAADGIYFRSSKFLFRFHSGDIKVWKTSEIFNASVMCRGTFFLQRKKTGLMQIVNNALEISPGGEIFAAMKISMMAPYDDKTILVGTRYNGIYLYDGEHAVPFATGADEYLKEKQLYHGIRLRSGDIALATLRGGLVVIGANGQLKQIFGKGSGLQDDNVKFVFQDSHGTLWLALQKGIAKIEYDSPFSIYNKQSNLPGMVLSVTRHGPGGKLYAGTTEGIFYLPDGGSDTFSLVPGVSAMCPSLLSAGDALLAATGEGILQITGDAVREVSPKSSTVLVRSKQNPGRTWGGTSFGLVSIVREKRNRRWQWREEHRFNEVTQKINTIVEDVEGNLWLGTLTKGVLHVRFPQTGKIGEPVVAGYDTTHGLPDGAIHVFTAAGHVMFASPAKGLFRFNPETGVFTPDNTLGKEFADGSRGVFRLAEDMQGNIWLHSMAMNIQAIPQPGMTYHLNKTPFLRIPVSQVNAIYPDTECNVTWFAGNNGLIRCDTTVEKTYLHDFSAIIRKVTASGKPVFGGYADENAQLPAPVLEYRDRRTIGFQFAAPFSEAGEETKYRHLLEGYEDEWSNWSRETRKNYFNLDSGTYRFRVRAKNVYENPGREAVFRFKILPPWYKSWWAYWIYVFGFIVLVYGIVRWRSRKLQQIIRQRTKEIEGKNRLLEEQSGKLQELDRIKSRFFANISHEFRTPLTLIMGPIEQMLSQCGDAEEQKKLGVVLKNSQRLLSLINQLLELSKFDSGNMKLHATAQNIVPFLKGIVDSFSLIATENQLDLTFQVEDDEDNISIFYDPAKLEDVVFNIMINAVKFTPPGGRIWVSVKRVDPGKTNASAIPGFLEIEVCDTGIGIPGENLEYIFDRFYQAKSILEHKHKGTGIGLALTRELVKLHHGEIKVESSEGKGSRFVVLLPLGKSHLKPGEITWPETPYSLKNHREIPAFHRTETRQTANVPPAAEEGTPGSREKEVILVVEDSADTREYIRSSLEPLYRVIEAKDGQEGLQTAQTVIPDLIISDIMMPEMDGHELCRVLKNQLNTSHIPVILLTARASDENIVQGLETGADDYITKPFNTKILYARIKNLIDLRRQLHREVDRKMTLQPASIPVSKIDTEFLEELDQVIEKNLPDPEFNVEELGRKLYMSRANLYRKIHAMTGKTPSEYIRSYRLKRSAQLFKRNFGSVTEVAFEVGFSSRTYFTKCFKEQFHQLPSTYMVSESSESN